MATTLTGDDSARAALGKGDEIMARLDEMTTAKPSMAEQLDELEPLLDAAVNSGDEAKVRRLVQVGKEIVRTEKMAREQALEEATDYFNEALKEYGETGEETVRSSQEVTNWKKSLQDFDAYIVERERYYDDVLANMHTLASSLEPQPEARPEVKERAKTLEELMHALDNVEAAYKAKLGEIQAEKKNIAAQLTEKRIARLKATISA